MIEQRAVPKSLGEQSPKEAHVRETSSWIIGEPSVQDLLRDPLVHSILRRDGLSPTDLLQAIDLGRHRLAPIPERPPRIDAA